jgi:Concanavalin A-like lectin/glucanases superfamily
MQKALIMVIMYLVCGLSVGALAEDRIFMMKTYAAKLEKNGVLTVDSEGYKVLSLPLMTFNDKVKTHKRIWPPRKFTPVIKVSKSAESTVINISYSKAGLVKSFEKTITLMPDSISVEAATVPFRTFYSCSSGIEIYPKVFDGAKYVGLNRKKLVSGKMPAGIPVKNQFTLNGLGRLEEITFTQTKVGTVSFNFTRKSPRGLSDLRAAAWLKKYNFHFFKIKYPANKVFKYAVTIKINNTNKVDEKVAVQKLPPTNVLFELDFEDGFNAKARGRGKVQNQNTPELVAGIHGKAAQFSNRKVLQYLEQGNLKKTKGSLSFWVKADDILDPYKETQPVRILFTESGRSKPGSNIFKLWKSTWGGLRFDLRNKGNDFWGVYDIYNWGKNEWHHVTLTWNNKKGIAIYVDGRLKQTAENSKQKRGLMPLEWAAVPAQVFFIGAKDKRGNAAWRGALDEIRIFDRDLTPAEIQQEYERFANKKLKIFTYDQYLFAGKKEACKIILDNNSDKSVNIVPECAVTSPNGKTVFTRKFMKRTIKAHTRSTLKLSLNLPSPGDYTLKISYGNNTRNLVLKALPQKENAKAGGKLVLDLVKTIDAVNPQAGKFVAKGDNTVVDSPIGKYRETGTKFHDRFAFGFELPATNVPYLAVVTWPDNAKRSMEILFHSERGRQSYQAPGGIFTGDAFTPSGKMKEYKVVFWPRTKQSAFIFMCLENGYPAAVKNIKIYRIKSGLPKLTVNKFAGSVPARHIGTFYEDPVIPMCFGAGSLFPDFEKSVDRLLDYMQWFGQDIFTYPIVWYHGPLYGSEAEPTVANRAVRMHPENYPAYLLKRLQARGMKFNGILNINRLESLDNMAVIDERRVFKGEETVANMRYDNHLQLTTPWNCKETRYNNLDPRVQDAVKKIVREIMERYGDNPAFSGIMIFAKGKGLFGLGTLKGGYNDINLTRFQHDTGIKIPCYDPKDTYRFAKSYQWLIENRDAWNQWITWRCKMLHKFYKEMADIVTAKRKDLRLSVFCPASNRNSSFSSSAEYRNTKFSINDHLRENGIDLDMFSKDSNIEICTVDRTNAMQHHRRKHGHIIEIESLRAFGLIPEIAEAYKDLPQVSSVLFDAYFEDSVGRSATMENLKQILPKTRETSWRCSAINNNTFYGLEKYVAALNNVDAVSITKGGFAIGTLGIEDWIGRFAKAYRTLPAVKFDNTKKLEDPVRVRQKVVDGRNYFYILNRLPVEVKFTLKLSENTLVKDLVNGTDTRLEEIILKPYGLRTFSAPVGVKVVSGTSTVPDGFVADLKVLLKKAGENFGKLKKNSVPMENYKKFLDAAQACIKEKRYARLYILLYESWVNDMKRLLDDSNLQEFLKVDRDYIKKQNRKRYSTVIRCTTPIKIDGVLDEKEWKNAAVITDFADFLKFKGKRLAKPAGKKTAVRFLYDDKNIYLGITCEEPDTDNIIIKQGLKDGSLWENDSSVEFFLKGSDMTKGQFAQLLVNAGSSKTDIFGGGAGRGWNIDWQAQSKIIPGKGWVCEIAVPLKEIGKTKDNKLLFNIGRHRGAKTYSGLSQTEDNGWFCEEFWMELDLK